MSERYSKCNKCGCRNNDSAEEAAFVAAEAFNRCEEKAETRERRRTGFSDPICIHTDQIYDSCRDRDCIKDSRVYFTQADQELIDNSINVKVKKAEIIWVYTDVEEVPFNRGFFSVDIKYFICVTLEVFTGVCQPCIVRGLTTFDKRVILFGSEGNAMVFTSTNAPGEDVSELWQKNGMPTAIVEVVQPIPLAAKLVEDDCCCCCCSTPIPQPINNCFDNDLVVGDTAKKVLVTLGIFTIVRLERNTQLLIDAIDFCVPKNECAAATEDNPCELFNGFRFPVDEFFPPQKSSEEEDFGCGCNHGCGCDACKRNTDRSCCDC